MPAAILLVVLVGLATGHADGGFGDDRVDGWFRDARSSRVRPEVGAGAGEPPGTAPAHPPERKCAATAA